MTAQIAAWAAAAVIAVMFLPVRLRGRYEAGKLCFALEIGPFRRELSVHRRGKRVQKKASRGSKEVRFLLLGSALRTVKGMVRYVSFRDLRIHYTAGGQDPYAAAMAYGRAGAAMDAIAACVPGADLRVGADLTGGPGELSWEGCAAVRMGNLLEAGAAFGTDCLRQYFRYRRRRRAGGKKEG